MARPVILPLTLLAMLGLTSLAWWTAPTSGTNPGAADAAPQLTTGVLSHDPAYPLPPLSLPRKGEDSAMTLSSLKPDPTALVSLSWTILAALIGAGIAWGMLQGRVGSLERDVSRLERQSAAAGMMVERIAKLESRFDGLTEQLGSIDRKLDLALGRGVAR